MSDISDLSKINLMHLTPSTTILSHTVRSESRCSLRLRYVDLVQACIDTRGYHFQHNLQVHSDFPNADLQKVFANKLNGFRPV
jgi:hypothetical protein